MMDNKGQVCIYLSPQQEKKMKDKEALKLVLEALRNVPMVGEIYDQQHSDTHMRASLILEKLLAQLEQEPKLILDAYRIDTEFFGLYENAKDHPNAVALYRLDKQPTQQHEPVAEVVIGKHPWDYGLSVVYLEKCLPVGTKLYTTPPPHHPTTAHMGWD